MTGTRRTCAVNPRDLIETARGLTELSPRRPTQANLRRAVSIADVLMGKGRNEAWHRVYRALEHANARNTSARNACRNMGVVRGFSPGIQGFAEPVSSISG